MYCVFTLTSALLTWSVLSPSPSLAQNAEADTLPIPEAVRFETSHSGTFNGEDLSYRAIVADIQLERADGTPYVSLFTTSYLKETVDDLSGRPVTFVFNGGPGSSSVWLHLGLMGPRRVSVPGDAGHAGSPPYSLVDNPLSPLDATDLVFIDPAGTGFSRLVGDGKAEDVYGLREDARSVAALIREWIRDHGRWNSPIFIAGESYGTTRAAALLPELMRGSEPLGINGVILVSQALDYQGSSPYVADNLTSFVTYLPTMAATAWYHGKVDRAGRTLEGFLGEVRDFAVNQYLPELFMGSQDDEGTSADVARRYAEYIGLDLAYVQRSRLRVSGGRYVKELLRDEGLAVGRLDGRYTADEIDDVAERPSFDAASAAISAAYSSLLHGYLRDELGVTLDRPYHVSGPDVGSNWVWDRSLSSGGEPRYVNTAPDLAWALSYNPELQVMVASGYYDYATPFFDAEYTFARHGIDMDRVTMTYYEAGHMMYVHDPSLRSVAADIQAFIRRASGGRGRAEGPSS
jgi:carboxypeptidase C (cathepsin A)